MTSTLDDGDRGRPFNTTMFVNIWLWGLVSLPLAILLWLHRLYSAVVSMVFRSHERAALWEALRTAETYEAWEAAARALDRHYGIDEAWRCEDRSGDYAWQLIGGRRAAFAQALQAGHVQALEHLLQSGLVRNLGNITAPALYNAAFAGTKVLIERYVLEVCEIVHALAVLGDEAEAEKGEGCDDKEGGVAEALARAVARAGPRPPLPSRAQRRQLCRNMRQSFGHTTLVLQGGSIFGLYHLGVARALFLRGLLPRIVTGTGTGALIAALLATHTDADLRRVMDGDGIDLSAFYGPTGPDQQAPVAASRWATLRRRAARFWSEGYLLDAGVLAQCVRDNGGDLTFEEAFQRTGRTLNIMVGAGDAGAAVPAVLNYVTAPNVLIWTAAVASNMLSVGGAQQRKRVKHGYTYGPLPTAILCKDEAGRVVPWPLADAVAPAEKPGHYHQTTTTTRDAPLQRVSQLFNVNHFLVSQARPYLVPFLRPSLHGPAMHGVALGTLARAHAGLRRQAGRLVRHRLDQLGRLGWVPQALRRLVLDEQLPVGDGHDGEDDDDSARLVLVPSVSLGDYLRLLDAPTPAAVRYWLRKGEQAVWPAVAAIRMRCAVELALEEACRELGG